MSNLFTDQELINIDKQVEMDRERIFTEKGIAKGREEGIAKGQNEEKISIAKKMIKEKIPLEQIAKITGLLSQEIEKLC